MAWNNDDGLYIKFGTEKAAAAKTGEFGDLIAGQHITELLVADATDLADTNAIWDDTASIPAGARISKVEIVVDTALTSGGAAALDVGWVDAVDRTSNSDDDAFVAAAALTTLDADGDIVEYIQGGTGHGAGIGTTLSTTKLVTIGYDTSVYTAGAFRVRIYWYT